MKLNQAYLCIDCEEVFGPAEGCNPSCPSCNSRVFVLVAAYVPTMKMVDRVAPRSGVTTEEKAALAA